MEKEKMYMNVATGSVDTRDNWWYTNNEGEEVNAVDREEVLEVEWSTEEDYWVLVLYFY